MAPFRADLQGKSEYLQRFTPQSVLTAGRQAPAVSDIQTSEHLLIGVRLKQFGQDKKNQKVQSYN
jgi:hypothetical protein